MKLEECKRNVHSQNGEDGVLEEIFKRLGIATGQCCEFGAWDGIHLSNTWKLLKEGWAGCLIEGDPEKVKDLNKNTEIHEVKTWNIGKFVDPHFGDENCLDNLLASTPIRENFELLSIDVDGPDYWIWKSLTNFTPKVVVIECSGNYEEDIIYRFGAVHKRDKDGSTAFKPLVALGKEKGYTLVCDTGNLIFVKNEYVSKVLR